MVGAIPRQPRRFWGVPDWQVSSANCANDHLLRSREVNPEQSRVLLQRGKCGRQPGWAVVVYTEGLRLAGTSGGYLDQPHLQPLPINLY